MCVYLLTDASAPIHTDHSQPQRFGELLALFSDLQSQFSCGGHYHSFSRQNRHVTNNITTRRYCYYYYQDECD